MSNYTKEELLTELTQAQQRVAELEKAYAELEQQVTERTTQLKNENQKLKQAEAELRKSEAHNQALLNAIPDMMFQLDREGVFLSFQAASNELYLKPEEIIGTNINDTPLPDFATMTMHYITQALTTGKMQTYEYQLPLPHGVQDYEARMVSAGPDEVFALVRNITDRKQTEAILRQREEQYRMLFERMLNGFALHEIIVDEQGHPCDYRFLEVNPTFEEMTTLSAEMIVGKRVLDVLPDTEAYWIETYGNVALTGEPLRFENYTEALGKHFEVFAFSPKKGQFATIFTDITDRKRTEQALRDSEASYKLALASTNDGLWDWNLQTNEVYFSDRYYTQLDYEPGDFPMVFASWENLVHPDDLLGAKQDIQAYITGQADSFKITFRARSKTGQWKYILATGRIVDRDEEGKPQRMIGIHTDITPLKQAEEEQQRMQQEIIEAQRHAIQELSVPIIPVMDQIIVMPLIGSIDSMRARDLMRTLLAGISEHRAKVVILDITGVPIVDTGVVAHLDKTIQAARLKGSRTIVTGISDAVAEALVDLGIDWSQVETLRDLQTGLMVALQELGVELRR